MVLTNEGGGEATGKGGGINVGTRGNMKEYNVRDPRPRHPDPFMTPGSGPSLKKWRAGTVL